MIKNRADKLVLKAFLELQVPRALQRENPELAVRGGENLLSMANRLLMGRSESIEILTPGLLTKEDKTAFNNIISRLPDGEEKAEMVFFYRLAILVETILLKYRTEYK